MWNKIAKFFSSKKVGSSEEKYKDFYSKNHLLFIDSEGNLSYTPVHGRCYGWMEGYLGFNQYYFFYDKTEWEDTDYKGFVFVNKEKRDSSDRPILDVINEVYLKGRLLDVCIFKVLSSQ